MDALIRRAGFIAAAGVALLVSSRPLSASGHGPVFGASTPTLGKGGWSFDQAWMGQITDGPDTTALRSMIGFGITERVQISGSLPITFGEPGGMPSGRMTAMMSGNSDVESLLAWRFQSRPVGAGARFESTAYVGGLVPLDSRRAGISTSPAALVSLASGYASRSHYFWAGASHLHYAERDDDRLGSVTSFTAVYGFRPPAWRKDYPKPDLRFFVEAAGDVTGKARHNGQPMTDTGGRVVLVGPTMLLLYKAYAVEGGVLFPVYQDNRPAQQDERFRVAVNFTYFFWPSTAKEH
jgi:hypothetical protein